MTLSRKNSFIKKAKDISIGGALTVAFASCFLLTGCSSNQEKEADYSYEEVSYGKGIRSHIKEVAPGEFKIMDEESVEIDSAAAIVSYLDGHTDTLTIAASQALIEKDRDASGNYVGQHSGLTSMLMYGGMGFMMARMMNNGFVSQQRNAMPNTNQFYGNQSAYDKSQTATRTADASRTARTVNARPSSGKSGFFGSKSAPGPAAS